MIKSFFTKLRRRLFGPTQAEIDKAKVQAVVREISRQKKTGEYDHFFSTRPTADPKSLMEDSLNRLKLKMIEEERRRAESEKETKQ